ncbi:MAG: hypothetical protein QF593_00895, partial [Nitrospinota bacterium]|nr:hypothetical protein [Nitrospinota bacterium]
MKGRAGQFSDISPGRPHFLHFFVNQGFYFAVHFRKIRVRGRAGLFEFEGERLFDARFRACRHDGEVGAQEKGFENIVGYVKNCLLRFDPDFPEFHLKMFFCDGVEGGEGFVHEKDVGIVRKRPGDLNPLLHSAGELEGKFSVVIRQADEFDIFVRASFPFRRIDPS